MQFDTIAQGAICRELIKDLSAALAGVRSWEDQVSRLNRKINTENWLLDDLRRQADQTGDHEAFAPHIRRVENKIENLERQVIDAETKVREIREETYRLEGEMNREGCHGVA